ncbi:SpoIIE family protein phosphatase [Vicingaceae bacterium]|nr:SpoIIE family protein phosphatase [Vicingaceae bacterium]
MQKSNTIDISTNIEKHLKFKDEYDSIVLEKATKLIAQFKFKEVLELCSAELLNLDENNSKRIPYLLIIGEAHLYSDQFALASGTYYDVLILLAKHPSSQFKGITYVGLSYVSRFIKDYKLAISYAEKALALKNISLETTLKANLSIGISKGKIQDYYSSREILQENMVLAIEVKSISFEVSCLKGLGDLSQQQKNYIEAKEYYELALERSSILNHFMLSTLLLISLGDVSFKLNKIPVNLYIKAISIAKKHKFIEGVSMAYSSLSSYYASVNNKEMAYECLHKSIDLKEQNGNEIKKQLFYQNQIDYVNKVKNKEIELLTEISIRHEEIKDSIDYARRIQKALLPSVKRLNEALNNSFVFNLPKDIVSGDFYWFNQTESATLFAVADCTGHGVPGALVSIVCNNALNRAVNEFYLTDPGEILDKVKALVVDAFYKESIENKIPLDHNDLNYDRLLDGMDIALCSIMNNELKYAGAHNPLWIIRNEELIEYKADKQPIGNFDHSKPFTSHTVPLKKEDMLYIFSDGYADQFGGYKGKKLKTKFFKEYLIEISRESLIKQNELLNIKFNEWKGDLEQVDDVCVLGLRI